jgi:poly(hydroxyalkanoate) granule-associated protein
MTMTKKDKLFDTELAASVRESAQQIWLAGLGAFAKAQAEGAKAFESLVKEGSELQQKTRSAYGDKFGEVGQRMQSVASEVTAKAGQQFGKLEAMFEERIARVMQRIDTPTRDDLDALRARVDDLEAKLKAMVRRPAAKKAAAKRAPRRAAGD